ncbi:RNA methyltransferase [Bacteroidota bacterium]
MRKLKNSELGRLSIEEYKSEEKIPIVVVLDNVRSLHNVGSVFRTCDAFKIKEIYLCGITGTPPNKEIHKTALGATESVNWKYKKSAIEVIKELRDNKYIIIAVEQAEGSILLKDLNIEQHNKYVIVFGNEVKGVNQDIMDICDKSIEIPQYGTKHSLNISVSVGIVIWELFNKIKKG